MILAKETLTIAKTKRTENKKEEKKKKKSRNPVTCSLYRNKIAN